LTSVGNNGGFSIGQVPYPSGQNTCRNAGALVDVNNDGYIDIVLPCQQLFVLMGSPAGDYTQSYAFTSSASNFRSLTAIDINRDGFIDIAAETSWEFVIFTNNKDGTFAARPKVSFLSSGEGNISTGDINGDGYLDLVKTNTKSLSVFFGTAGGGLGSEIAYPAGLIQFATTYDIDQDGRDDILAAVLDEGLVIYPSKGCSP
jgi:hypothetical protein